MAQVSKNQFSGYLLGVGNPLLDITAHVGQDVLDQYGLVINTATIAEDKHKALFDELASKHKVEYAAGGATLNAVRVAQWLLQEEGASAFVGAIGKDPNGATLRQCASKDGVALHAYEVDAFATGTCAVLVKDKQHALVANLAAAKQCPLDYFDSAEVQALVNQAKIISSSAYFLTVCPAIVNALGARCVAEKKVFTFSLGSGSVAPSFSEALLKALEFSDFVFATATDAREFAKSQDYSSQEVRDVALHIAQLPKASSRPRVVVITQGTSPTIVAQQTRVVQLPVYFQQAEVVDPNGVGDAFVGGFLAGLARGLDLEDRVNAGHYAASVVSQVSGCNPNSKPKLDLRAVREATEKIKSLKKSCARQADVKTAVRALTSLSSGGEQKDEDVKEANDSTSDQGAVPVESESKGEVDKEKGSKGEKAKSKKAGKDKRKKSEKGDDTTKENQNETRTEDPRADPAAAPEEVPAVRVHVEGDS